VKTLPWTGMPILVAPVAGLLMNRIGPRNVLAAGLAGQAAGLGWLAAMTHATVDYPALIPGLVLCGVGMGLFFPPVARLVLGFAPAELSGVASGVSNALRQLGTVLGVAVLGTVFSANGAMTSGQSFADGLLPALWTGAALVTIAVVAALAIPRSLPAPALATEAPATEAPATEAPATEAPATGTRGEVPVAT